MTTVMGDGINSSLWHYLVMNGSNNNMVVMATVKGDVHDVGSIVVSVGLSCNNLLL